MYYVVCCTFFTVCVFFFFFASSTRAVDIDNQLVQSGEGTPSILIASQDSDFKDAVVARITSTLDLLQLSYKVTDVSTLKKVDEDEWDAIVIVQTVKMGKINKHVRRYLDDALDLDKIVLVTTAGSGDPRTDAWDVDTITCASKMEELENILEQVLMRLEMIVGGSFST